MADKLSPKRVSLSLAFVTGIVSIICALLIAIFPEATLKLFGAIFHGIDITKIATVSVSFGSAILGTLVAIVLALIVGWLFAVIYNKVR